MNPRRFIPAVRFCTVLTCLFVVQSAARAQTNGIVDGRPATPDETWATVALVDPGSQEIFCTGTLISPTVVLTAAHCVLDWSGWAVVPDDLNVVTGALVPEDAAARDIHRVARVEPHPNYGGAVWDDAGECDIALLVLDAPVTSVKPAAVLPPERVAGEMTLNRWLTLAGYGEASDGSVGVLQVAEAPLTRLWETEFVAGAIGTPDTCFGDSGGPVYLVDDRGGLYVVGVTSRAQDDATIPCGEGGVYTLAPAYVDWLASASGGAFNPAAPPPLVDAPEAGAAPDDGGDFGPTDEETPGEAPAPEEDPDFGPDFGPEFPLPNCSTAPTRSGRMPLLAVLGVLGALLGSRKRAR